MYKKYFIAILFAAFTVFVSAQVMNDGSRYAQSSVLKSGKWVKIGVEKSGIYKLTYEKLVSMGITNPANVRVFGYGGALLPELFTKPYIDDLPEVAIYMKKSADGTFKAGDYILFYAQGVVSWSYGRPPNSTELTNIMFYRTRNYYSTKGYYFVTSDAGVGKKISMSPLETATSSGDIEEYTHYDLHEKELVNLANSGREFYGEEFTTSVSYTFDTPNLLTKPEKIRVKVVNRGNNGIYITTKINGATLSNGNNYIGGRPTSDAGIDKPMVIDFQPISETNQAFVQINSDKNTTANLDFIEINVRRKLTMNGNEFYFRNKEFLNQNQHKRFVLKNADSNTQIWDITDKQNIKQINATLVGNQLTFVANTDSIREYLAIKPSANFPPPDTVFSIDNQNLHSLPQADYVIIANKDFLSEAKRLAQAHQRNGLSVIVANAEHVYNEFSSGTPDATAYRRFVKMFYDRGVSNTNGNAKIPKYLLLFGTGSFDNRALLNITNTTRRMLTYQSVNSVSNTASYVSDDYFGYMDDSTGVEEGGLDTGQQMKVGVGRFPVYSLDQAKTLVDKTINYMDNTFRGSWKNQVLYIADDGNLGNHARDADEVSKITANTSPEILIKKLYLDAFKQVTTTAGESYPDVERLLDNYIRQGVLMINYMGHGSPNSLASEQILTQAKIDRMYNDKLPIYITATCDFTPFDHFNESAGEKLLWNKNGGAIALFSTTRTVYADANARLNENFASHFFDKDEDCNPLALGDVFRLSKNLQKSSNKFSFTLVGDPALKLVYPHQAKVITDSINFNPVNLPAFDTVSALGIVHISGHIENCYGDEIQGFNGFVNINVFDKEEVITTLNNPGGSDDNTTETNIHFKYQDRPNPIFVGSAEIKNGRFRIAFIVPKDIKYNFGTGRIVYYASEDNLGMEANGYFENFIIGGEATNIDIDTIGPEVKLYMNTPTFKNGGQVNISPLFVAEVFDQSGINTIGIGIGHDITMRLSGVDKNGKSITKYNNKEIVLNNYYEAEFGSYQKGKVKYQLNDLEEGIYSIKFRIWDVYNNSTTSDISFFVSTKGKIVVDTAKIYPNPATVDETITFSINHNRPGQLINIGILVSDLTGRTVWSSSQSAIASETEIKIQWNPAAEGGILATGLYIVRLELSTLNEKSTFVPLKLIIKTK